MTRRRQILDYLAKVGRANRQQIAVNIKGKPTYLLRMKYDRRLAQVVANGWPIT